MKTYVDVKINVGMGRYKPFSIALSTLKLFQERFDEDILDGIFNEDKLSDLTKYSEKLLFVLHEGLTKGAKRKYSPFRRQIYRWFTGTEYGIKRSRLVDVLDENWQSIIQLITKFFVDESNIDKVSGTEPVPDDQSKKK